MKKAMKLTGFGLLTGAAILMAGTAMARGPMGSDGFGPGGRGGLFAIEFAALDLDGNGQITEEDLLAGAEAKFAEADADGNGTLDEAELTAQVATRVAERAETQTRRMPRGFDADTMAERMAERMIDKRDADEDGVLSLAELGPDDGFGRMIDRFDTDDDNAISEAEFDEIKADMEERMARRGDGKGGRDGGRGDDRGGKRR